MMTASVIWMKSSRYTAVWVIMLFVWITNYMARTVASPAVPAIIGEFMVSYEFAGAWGSNNPFHRIFFDAVASGLPWR